ncbi:MAG: hypothetical protein ACC707_20250, partial [Thiohalomonadales bacterium]
SSTGQYESISDNSGKLSTKGIELIVKYNAVEKVDLEFSTVWQETKDKQNPQISVGESPEWLAKMKASYVRNNIIYSVFANYTDSMNSDFVFVESTTPGLYTRLGDEVDDSISVGINIRYSQPSTGFYAQIHVENLFNDDIYTPANELVTMEKGLLSQERQIMLTIGLEY